MRWRLAGVNATLPINLYEASKDRHLNEAELVLKSKLRAMLCLLPKVSLVGFTYVPQRKLLGVSFFFGDLARFLSSSSTLAVFL